MSTLHPDQLLQPGCQHVDITILTILLKAVNIFMYTIEQHVSLKGIQLV